MKIFFGAAIQGSKIREERARVHRLILDAIIGCGCKVISEHTAGRDYDDTRRLLEETFGPLPPKGMERTIFVRNKMIEKVESDIDAAVFEVSTPSLGTGIELAHAYLRPRMGLPQIPVIALYQRDYWPNNLSAMIRGISPEEVPDFYLKEYDQPEAAAQFIPQWITEISSNH
jgi:hypothetical protein